MLDMIEFAWNDALGNLVQVGLTVSAAALVLLLLRRVMKKRYPARAVCVVWAILAVRLLIPVQLTLPDPPVQVTPRTTYISNFTLDAETIERAELPVYEREGAVATQNWVSNDEAQALREAAGGPGAFSSFDWGRILCLLWIVGIALFAFWQVYRYLPFRHVLEKSSHPAERETLQRVFEEQKRSLGIKRNIPLRVTPAADCPMLAGFIKPALYLPDEALYEQEAGFIFRHELTHYKRGDLWLKLALVAARAMHWFNPLVHLMARFAQEDIELACDDAVVRGMDGEARRAYGETILRSAAAQARKHALVSCFTGDKQGLMRRFEGIFDKRVKKRGVALILAAAVLVGTLGCAVSIGEDKGSLTEELRIQLAEQWAQSGNPKYGYTVKLDGDNTYALFDHTNTVMWDDAVIESVPHRLCWQLSFEKGEDGWQVSDAERIAENGVTSLDEFRILYENDLGFPDFLMVDWTDPLLDISEPDQAALNLLHLKNVGVSGGSSFDRTVGDYLWDVTAIFADHSEVTITMVKQFDAGWLPQDFTYDGGKNNRTAADLAGQYARGVVHKSGQFIYPILTAQKQQEFRTAQQIPGGGFSWKYGGSSPSYRDYALSPTSGGYYIAVFQMYGGGATDYRSAVNITVGTENGRQVITAIDRCDEQLSFILDQMSGQDTDYTQSKLFRLYYDSGLAWPTIPEGADSFNGVQLDGLTTPLGAIEAVFGYFGETYGEIEGNTTHIRMRTWYTVELVQQSGNEAVVRLNFTDGSPSVDVRMEQTGDYWLPVGIAESFDSGFHAWANGEALPSGATIAEAVAAANGNIPVLEEGTEIAIEPMEGKVLNLYGVLNDSIITEDGTKRLVESESEMYKIPFADENRTRSIYTVARHPSEVLLSTYGETVYRAVELTYHVGDDQTMYHAVFVYGIAAGGSAQPDYTITSTTYHNDTYGYTLTLPDCFVGQGYAVEGGSIVQFGLQNALPGYSDDPTDGGVVMTLQVEATAYLQELYGEDWQAEYAIPSKELAERNGLTWYLAFASDVQYDPTDEEITAAYTEMSAAAQAMGADAISFDGQTDEQRTNEQELLLRALARVYAAQNDSTAELIRDKVTILPEVADNAALIVVQFVVPTKDYFFTTAERVWYDRTDTTTPSRTETLVNTSDGVRSLEQFILAFPLEQELPYFDGRGLESLSDKASRPASLDNPDLSTPEACAASVLHLVGGEWTDAADDALSEDTTWRTYQWDDGYVQLTLQRVQLTDDSPVLWLPIGWRTEESGIGFVGQWPHYYAVLARMMDYYPYRTTVELVQALDMGWADGAYAEGIFAELDKRWQQDADAVEDVVTRYSLNMRSLWETHKAANPDLFGARFSDEEIEAAYQAVRDYAAANGFSVENLRYDADHDLTFSRGIMTGGVLQDNVQQDGLTVGDVITVVGDAREVSGAQDGRADGWSFTLYRGADGEWVLEDGAYGY